MIQHTKKLDKEKIYKLYEANEWIAYLNTFDTLLQGIQNSLDVISYFEGEQLIGLIRTVGDGQTIVYIQDILIHPEFQDKGIGTVLMQEVLNKYKHVRQICLMTDMEERQHHFYKKNGFKEITSWGGCAFTYDRNKES